MSWPRWARPIKFTHDEARDFIVENFNKFSPELGAFAQRAFDNNWIDAEQRDGKRGGAFCMGVAGVKESRILSNFDGSFDQVSTLAHELGHAFHNECAYQAGKTELQQSTPIDNNLLLINLLSNKTEENRELTEYENEANEEDFLYVILTNLHTDFRLFNLYFHHSLTEISLIPKCSLIVKYCSLKLPF